jgi:hypothetical protein
VLAGIALLVSLDLDISPDRCLRNDVLFRGASSIEAIYSDHDVRMRYRPPGFAAGVALSSASLAALGLGGLAARRRRESA